MPKGTWERGVWPPEIIEYMHAYASEDLTMTGMLKSIEQKFGKTYTYEQMKGYYFRNKLPYKRNSRHNLIMTDEMAEYLASVIPGRSSEEAARMLNEKYGSSITQKQVASWKKNHKTSSGYDARWRPGHVPWITGKKFPGRTNGGTWMQGHISANAVPLGSERVTEGYTMVKVAHGRKNKDWEFKHRLIWEAHNGPIPEGHCVIFLDGDRSNFDISNLALVSQQELAYVNCVNGLTKDPEINRSIIALSKVQAAVKRRKDGQKEGK